MTKTSKAAATPRNPTRGEIAIQEFANSDLQSEESRQRAAPLLNSKGLLRDVQRLTPEDQTRFVDKIDRVRRNHSERYFFLESSLHYFCQGISNHQLAKCEVHNHIGDRLQRNPTTSNLGNALQRT